VSKTPTNHGQPNGERYLLVGGRGLG
jgi:hypothetical protein